MILFKKQLDWLDKIKEINKKECENCGQKLAYIETFGCILNENDSEKIAGMLEQAGYSVTIDENLRSAADLVIFNTCCIRENAEEKLFGRLGEVKKQAIEKGSIIILCGCMMQQKHILEKIKKSYPFVDYIFGTHTIYNFPENLYNVIKNRKRVIDIEEESDIFEGMPTRHTKDKFAIVPIIYGCNNFCSYCIVPYVRGREKSRDPEEILSEVKKLANDGYTEIMLVGQNVNSYKGKGAIDNFAKLLDEVAMIPGISKIRFISPHPKDFTEDVAKVIAKHKNISRNLHYPLQSGSDKVLKEMNRKYTKAQYLERAENIRKYVPDVTFSTDIIVGFPGETEEDFKETLDVVRKMRFEQIFMFIYSKRKGTMAEKMENQVPEEIAHERFNRLQKTYEKILDDINNEYIGKIESIIIDEETSSGKDDKNTKDSLKGRLDSNKIVVIPKYDGFKIGEKIEVEILENRKWYLKGRKV